MSLRLALFLSVGILSMLPAADAPDQPTAKLDRSGAPDQRFMKRHQEFVATAMKGGYDLVLVGDYLTDDFRGNAKNGVAAIFQGSFSSYHPINLGQGGDYTQHVLWRLQNGELDGYTPTVMMLMIGGTNGSNGEPPERILAGVQAIIACARAKVPGLKVLLLPVLPWDRHPGDHRSRHQAVNALLPQLDDGGKSVLFVDIAGAFLAADGTIPEDLMPDAAHLSDKGYQLWADSVAAALARLKQGTPPER
jgi:lysophospholipase L1-like esterase